MKNLQKFAVALLVGIMAIGFSAFTSSNKLAVQQWHFKNGLTLDKAHLTSSYEPVSSPSCNSNPGKPCIIAFDTSNPATPNLSTYLASFGGDDAAIAADAITQRDN